MSPACTQAVNRRRGVLYAFVCAVFFTAQDLFAKLAMEDSSAYQVNALRSLILSMCCIPTLLISQDGRHLLQETRHHYKLLGARASVATVSALLVIVALSYADIGSVTAIFNSMPVFAGMFGWILLKEPFTMKEMALSISSLTGVVLVAQPPFIFRSQRAVTGGDSRFVGAIIALVGAAATALSLVLSRMLSKRKVHPLVNMFYFGTVSTISLSIFISLFRGWTLPRCGLQRLYLVSAGVSNFLVQALLIKSLELEKPVTVTVTLTLNIVFAFVAQFLFLGETFELLSVIGAGTILVSSIGIALSKSKTQE